MTCAVETSRKVVDSILVAASRSIGVGKLSRKAHNEHLFDGLSSLCPGNPSKEVSVAISSMHSLISIEAPGQDFNELAISP